MGCPLASHKAAQMFVVLCLPPACSPLLAPHMLMLASAIGTSALAARPAPAASGQHLCVLPRLVQHARLDHTQSQRYASSLCLFALIWRHHDPATLAHNAPQVGPLDSRRSPPQPSMDGAPAPRAEAAARQVAARAQHTQWRGPSRAPDRMRRLATLAPQRASPRPLCRLHVHALGRSDFAKHKG